MIDFGLDFGFWLVLYMVVVLVIGWMGRQARGERSLGDYFLANRSLGLFVLTLTLFSTQYSGNSLSGFPGQTYREGLSYFMSVTFMVGIVAGYMLFAPRLYALAGRRSYITPTDFLHDRFRSPTLNYVSAAIFAWALLNFLWAQLTALGSAVNAFTDGRVPHAAAVLVGAAVILAYVVMGGMRAVAWTDVFQGVLLGGGILCIVVLMWVEVGSPTAVIRSVQLLNPDMVANPSLRVCLIWISNFLLLALGAPLYPQAVQRIFAARGLPSLRRALAVMAVIPLLAAVTVIFIGAVGLALFPQLDQVEADLVTFRVVSYLVQSNAAAYYPALLVMLAVIAAVMSTADSCLLSLSSILTRDVVARRWPAGDPSRLMRWAVIWSVAAMAVVVLLALRPRMTLWGLLVIKFEVLIQLSPAFVLGTLHDRDHPRAFIVRDILRGLTAGLLVTLGLYVSPLESFWGLHFGTVGVAVNYVVVLLSRRARSGPTPMASG